MDGSAELITATENEPVAGRVLGALSVPRLGFMDPMFLSMQLVQMGVEMRKHSGAFWEQSLSMMLYQAVDEGFDYVLTIDYDSVFLPIDVYHMMKMLKARPDLGAIFPVQYRREADQLLVGLPGTDGAVTSENFSEQLVPATMGHFGLTLIRVAALKDMPHPWLRSQPNAEGKWDVGKIDADITFWNGMRSAGWGIACASRVVIGHIQQMITWPGEGYQPVHQYVGKYFGDGDAPPEVIGAAAKRSITHIE